MRWVPKQIQILKLTSVRLAKIPQIYTLDLSVLVLDDGTFVAGAPAEFDFLAVSLAEMDFTFDFSLSLSFCTMFAYEDDVVDVVEFDDTILVVDSSLVAAEVADILSRFNCVLRSLIEFGPYQCCCNFLNHYTNETKRKQLLV